MALFRRSYFNKVNIAINHEREAEPVLILAAGAIWAEGVYEGRILPALALDTSKRKDIEELISIHQGIPSGDASVAWGKTADDETVSLYISFIRPVKLSITLIFPFSTFGLVVDHIVDSRAFYIQAGINGTSISDNPDTPRLAIGLPDLGFRPHWRKMLTQYIRGLYRQKGYSRGDSKAATAAYLSAWDVAKRAPDTFNDFLDRNS